MKKKSGLWVLAMVLIWTIILGMGSVESIYSNSTTHAQESSSAYGYAVEIQKFDILNRHAKPWW
ncbi:hypothetical protein CathTA2_1981 [Caldalkalibacillus thermarum TA2.A1]|uniref:Uncharacterized protein n=1 Tax=Caldalkalibacillus thermarum (strain TA2.A1) TaxID=986075 RepID=F5L831_CALTT|nr:hypothetical protein [Caldalkalibacillus thermarum]EGL82539.1 hypothetical protein CathTA2_1981 [Caldalkalibacillus thermarum TA2.A1]QZT35530.1 hypothetical protein HUR95_11935 [Caldalkalibacillus thermarum TA2.A1]